MDTSETYIKMCEKAEEIQELRPSLMIGSIQHYYKGVYQYEIDSEGVVRFWNGHYFIWLPRQDQLQEIWLESFPGELIVERFYSWFQLLSTDFSSMEQLWLAFYMSEKHNKTWNGEGWGLPEREG